MGGIAMRKLNRARVLAETFLARMEVRTLFVIFLLTAVPAVAHAQWSVAEKPPAGFTVSDATPPVLTSYDLSDMDEAWWSELSEYLSRPFSEPEGDVEQAMGKIIFLSTMYPDKVNFRHVTSDLYNVYRFDRREDHRIMALAALYAIGDENAMRLLAYRGPFATYAPWETSDWVRRMTAAAVAQYYREAEIEVGRPLFVTQQEDDR
jgi:hypothetical protein